MNTPIIPPASMHFLSAGELENQASMTADEYLIAAIDSIDNRLGKGYAKAHPDLIGAFMRTSAQDFHTCFTSQILEQIAASQEEQATALKEIAERVGELCTIGFTLPESKKTGQAETKTPNLLAGMRPEQMYDALKAAYMRLNPDCSINQHATATEYFARLVGL